MSNTIVDMPKVCQALDAGWVLTVWKNQLGSYTAEAINQDDEGQITDDFTPEQALTRIAYKIYGEILSSDVDTLLEDTNGT